MTQPPAAPSKIFVLVARLLYCVVGGLGLAAAAYIVIKGTMSVRLAIFASGYAVIGGVALWVGVLGSTQAVVALWDFVMKDP